MLSALTKNRLLKEKRELLDKRAGLAPQIDGLKSERDQIVATRNTIDTRITEINGDLQL